METFKLALRWALFFVVFIAYYFIAIGIIFTSMSPLYGNSRTLDILTMFAVASPFLAVYRIIRWLSPGKNSRILSSILGGMIIVGTILQYLGATEVDKIEVGLNSVPMYVFHAFLALRLIMYKPKQSPKQVQIEM